MVMRTASMALTAGLVLGTPVTAFAAGWKQNADKSWNYEKEDGSILTDGFTPDGYYIDGSGTWWEEKRILGGYVQSRNYFLTAEAAGNFESFEGPLNDVQKVLSADMGQGRNFTIYPDKISYNALEDRKERALLVLHKDPAEGGYVLELRTALRKDQGKQTYDSWYDYQCLRMLCNLFSRTGDMLAEAVYESWESTNAYGLVMDQWVGVGDAEIRYMPADGAGLYYFRPCLSE